MTVGRLTNARLLGSVIVLAASLAACGQDNRYVAPPAPKVTVALPVQQTVTRYLEATGNAAAVNSTNLVARVQGFLQAIDYKDGDVVKQGTTLFTIEPEPYKLKLEQAQAAEAGARAALKQAEAEYERQTDLASRQVASKAALDNATANRDSALARLKQAQVDTKQAAINLGYTQVKAPFDGIVTARLVSLGELVGANGPTQLASIVQTDPIYVNFNISEQDVLNIRAEIRRLGITQAELEKVPIEVGLQTDKGYPHQGTLEYVSPKIDPSTGTLAVRAILKNPDGVLVPGYFVRVRVAADDATACWCRTPRSAATRAAAMCSWSTRTTWSSSARSRSVPRSAICGRSTAASRPTTASSSAASYAPSRARRSIRRCRRWRRPRPAARSSGRIMISDFFIRRPVLANVLAILMIVVGIVALFQLPVAQYPDVVPPTVQVTTRYPGASARTVVDAVALPIEQQVNGVEGMIYMQSFSGADGSYSLTVTFKIGVSTSTSRRCWCRTGCRARSRRCRRRCRRRA